MKLNTKNVNTIKRVAAAGYADEKSITALTAKQMVTFSKSLSDINSVVELQDAIKENRLLAYLIKQDSPNKVNFTNQED